MDVTVAGYSTMPKEQPVILLHFLMTCLDHQTFPNLISWVERPKGIFRVCLKRQNSSGWTVDYAEHFMAWDQIKGRETDPDSSVYVTNSRHRFKIALERMVNLKDMNELPNEGFEDRFHLYQFRSSALLHYPSSPCAIAELPSNAENASQADTMDLVHELTLQVTSPGDTTYSVFSDGSGCLWWSKDLQSFHLVKRDINETVQLLNAGVDLVQLSNTYAHKKGLPGDMPEHMEVYGEIDPSMGNLEFDTPNQLANINESDKGDMSSKKENELIDMDWGGNLGHCVESPQVRLSDSQVNSFFSDTISTTCAKAPAAEITSKSNTDCDFLSSMGEDFSWDKALQEMWADLNDNENF